MCARRRTVCGRSTRQQACSGEPAPARVHEQHLQVLDVHLNRGLRWIGSRSAEAATVGDTSGSSQPHPDTVGEPQLRAGMRPLFSDDQPHPGWSSGQLDDSGGFDDPGTVADFAVGVVGRCPVTWRQAGIQGVDDLVGESESDRILHPATVAVVEELMGAATGVCAHQHFPAYLSRRTPRQLRQGFVQHLFMVGGGIAPGAARRSIAAAGSPVPVAPWSMNAHNGWNPKPRLNVVAASSFPECASITVASRSISSGCSASIP